MRTLTIFFFCILHINDGICTAQTCLMSASSCRLVVDADNTPIVFPLIHTGMQNIMPIGANFPRIGQKVPFLLLELEFIFISSIVAEVNFTHFKSIKWTFVVT